MRNPPDREVVAAWLRSALAPLLRVAPEAIDGGRILAHYGLDSMTAMTVAADLEEWLGFTVPPTLVWEHPTLDQLATHVAGLAEARGEGRAAPGVGEHAILSGAEVDALLRQLVDEGEVGS